MAHIFEDFVEETTTTTGTGALTLAGAFGNYRAFSSVMANGDTCYAAIVAVDGNGDPTGAWETALCTWGTGGTLTRTRTIKSSNGNAAVVFAAGTKRVAMAPMTAAVLGLDPSGNIRLAHATLSTTPPADNFAMVPQRVAAGGGRVMQRMLGEDGIFTTMQPHWGRNCIGYVQGSRTNGLQSFGQGTGPQTVGTPTTRIAGTSNRVNRARRIGFVSAATAGSAAGMYNGGITWLMLGGGSGGGGGFFVSFVFSVSDGPTVAGAHSFIGVSSSTAAPSATANPNTFTDSIGLAQLNGGANFNIVYGGSAAQTAIDLGANFPANTNATDLYELILYARADVNNKVGYRVERINTGDVASGVLTGTAGTALPANTTTMAPRMYRANNATAASVGIDLVTYYEETGI